MLQFKPLPGRAEDLLGVVLCHKRTGRSGAMLRREAAAFAGVLILLLNIATGALSLSNFGTVRAFAFAQEGKAAICSFGGMHVLGMDGESLPGGPDKPQQGLHECTCCVLMQAGTALPPAVAAPKPAALAVIQLLRPGTARHLKATAVPTWRNRGPPLQA
jgi:hypothetical protein